MPQFNFVQVTGKPFTAICQGCNHRIQPGDGSEVRSLGPHFADLNGKPFEAYYCASCVRSKEAS